MQLVSTAAKALLATVKFARDLKNITKSLAPLLNEVENSISRHCDSCNVGASVIQTLEPPQLSRLSQSAGALHMPVQEIHSFVAPQMSS